MSPVNSASFKMKDRFRGFMPVVVDVETAGIVPHKNALLEICIVLLNLDNEGNFYSEKTLFEHVLPFEGAELDERSLEFNKIDPYQPLRFAIEEKQALEKLFKPIKKSLEHYRCQRAVLVGHNAWFDLLFLKEACRRHNIKSPFHAFTCFDTATLAGFLYGQTVLAKAMKAAGLSFNPDEAHSAIYDAEKTAELFCTMVNAWKDIKPSKESSASPGKY